MNMRKITSLTALVSFIITILTSVILYICPHGRVAYWADWRFWGLSKTQWGNIHINVGILFLLALLLHIYYNWKPITAYLKNKARQMKFFTAEMNTALLVTVVFIVGTLVNVPPFSSVLDFSESLKEAAARKYGDPPWGHAELSPIGTFAKKMGWQPDEAMAVLRQAGYEVSGASETVEEIARSKDVAPQELYVTLKSQLQSPDVTQGALPDTPPAGFGQRSLEEIAAKYSVPLKPMLEALKAQGVDADAATSLKSLASEAGRNPYELFDILKKAVESAPAAQNASATAGGQGAEQGGNQGKNQGKAAPEGQQPMGLGRMTLGDVVAQYNLDPAQVRTTLQGMGIEPDMEAKLRPLAESAGLTPLDIYNAVSGQAQ